MKNVWRTYLQTFNDAGVYTGTWVEVTKDTVLDSLGTLSSQLDNTTFDIGILRNSSLTLQLHNQKGTYSDVGDSNSMFHYKRGDTLFKLTWEVEEYGGPLAGVAIAGESYFSTETVIFTGLIVDEVTTQEITDQLISFTVLGRESLLKRATTPYASLSNGQLYSVMLYTILNQTMITNLLTVSQVNIVCGLDQTVDDVSSFQNKIAFESIANILAATNSVLFIRGDTIYVSARTAGSTVDFNFYGQGSTGGPENISLLGKIRTGLNRVLNYFTWSDTTLISQDTTSVAKYGAINSAISFDFMTLDAKRQNILDALLLEFKNPKKEFEISTPMTESSLLITLLSKISIDYPVSYISSTPFPICGLAICGTAILPTGNWAFSSLPTVYYKVIAIKLNIKTAILTFNVRLI